MHACAALHPRGEQRDERRVNEAPLVMALLRAGVGKEYVHAVQRVRSDHVLYHLDRVVLDDAQVLEMQLGDAFQQAADARGMDLDSEIVVLGMFPRDRRGGLAHAETDFEDPRRRAAEHAVQVERDRREGYAVDGQQLGVGAALGSGNAALAQDEASDLAPVFLQEMFLATRPSAGSGPKRSEERRVGEEWRSRWSPYH